MRKPRTPVRDRVRRRESPTPEEKALTRQAAAEEAATDRLLRGVRQSPISPRPRIRGGKFGEGATAPLPPPSAGPPPLPALFYPWYTVHLGSGMWDPTTTLPKVMEAALQPGSIAWPHPAGSGDPSDTMEEMLKWAGKHLLPKARGVPSPAGGGAMIRIRGRAAMEQALWPGCMQLDPKKIKATNKAEKRGRGLLVHRNPPPYYKVRLTEPVKGLAIFEFLHRLVLWAMKGPPPSDIVVPVAMHSCDNGKCVNWRHLSWGEKEENLNWNWG
jgi:hypothetical protein